MDGNPNYFSTGQWRALEGIAGKSDLPLYQKNGTKLMVVWRSRNPKMALAGENYLSIHSLGNSYGNLNATCTKK